MDSLTIPSSSDNTNMIFSSQKQEVVNTSRMGSSIVSDPLAHALSMPDRQWSFKEASQRPIPLGPISWATVQPLGTTLATYKLPSAIYGRGHYFIQMLQFISFFRCDLRIIIQLNSTRFHEGAVLAYFVPLKTRAVSPSTIVAPHGVHLFNAVILPHAIIDASQSTDASIIIPYEHMSTFFPLNNQYSTMNAQYLLGTLYFDVLVQLQAATGSTTTVSIFPWLEPINPRMHVPVYPHALAIPMGLEGLAQGTVGLATNILSGISALESGNIGGVINSAVGGIKSFGMLSDNLDKPSDPLIEGHKPVSVGNVTGGDGIDNSTRLSLGSASGTMHPSGLLGPVNAELDMSNLFKIPSIVEIVPWTITHNVGDSLGAFAVHPMVCQQNPYVLIDSYNIISPSNLGALTCRFQLWKGSIRYNFRIISTGFHTGRLRVSFEPNASSGSTFIQTDSLPQIIIDLREEKVFDFTVPFVSSTPWKYTNNSGNYGGFLSLAGTPETLQNSLGVLNLHVLNVLSAPSNVPASINIIVSMAGGDDFAVNGFRHSGLGSSRLFNPAFVPPTSHSTEPEWADAQAGDEEVSTANEAPKSEQPDRRELIADGDRNKLISGPKKVLTGFELFSGEDYRDVKTFLKRMALVTFFSPPIFNSTNSYLWGLRISNAPSIGFNIEVSNYPLPGSLASYNNISLFSYFTSLYAFWRGSIRYKLATNAGKFCRVLNSVHYDPSDYPSTPVPRVEELIPPVVDLEYFNCGTYLENISHSPCASFEVPYMSPYLSIPTYWDGGETSGLDPNVITTGAVISYYYHVPGNTPTAYDQYTVFVIHGAGDDFLPVWYIGPMSYMVLVTV
jgi:hypothetical protein